MMHLDHDAAHRPPHLPRPAPTRPSPSARAIGVELVCGATTADGEETEKGTIYPKMIVHVPTQAQLSKDKRGLADPRWTVSHSQSVSQADMLEHLTTLFVTYEDPSNRGEGASAVAA